MILAYILSFLFYILFFLLLILFHPIQLICHRMFGYESHKKSVDLLNFCSLKVLKVLNIKMQLESNFEIPDNRPLIIVSNHQGTFDIPPILWYFRKYHPKFISKKELAKNIPSISYNLRHSGAALIDRRNRAQAIPEIHKLGKLIARKNYAACIFPEGTRSKTGKMRKFKSGGIETLLDAAPDALIVPFAIDGNYKIEQFGLFPLSINNKIKYSILKPIEPDGRSAAEITDEAEKVIRKKLNQL